MLNILGNITACLGAARRDSLAGFDTVDVAPGYLALRGWSTFAPGETSALGSYHQR